MHPVIRFAAITASIAISTIALAHDPKTSADASMKPDTMQQSMPMGNMPTSGDQDHDFATMMRVHHQQALPMSRKEIREGKDPELRKMAQDIIKAQTKEIEQLDKWLANHKK